VAQADFVPPADEISAPIGAKGVTTIAMHDGSLVRFSAVPEGYDPSDRANVYQYMQEHQIKGVIPTGLLYLDESVPDMHEMNNTSDTPLAQVPFDSLLPRFRSAREADGGFSIALPDPSSFRYHRKTSLLQA
jgi:2-oxoglutarate ferredoxin oxidoreductase subunit beta